MIVADRLLGRGPDARRARHRHRPARAADARGHAGSSPSSAPPRTTTTRSATTRSTATRPRASSTATTARPGRPSSYQDGLEGAGKTGVGIYIDAKPKVDAVADADRDARTRAGGRRSTPPRRAPCRSPSPTAGRRSAAARSTAKDKRFKLDTGGDRVPLLPRLDHEARRRTPRAPRSPRSGCSRRSRPRTRTCRVRPRSARRASASSRSQSSGNGRPDASHSFG